MLISTATIRCFISGLILTVLAVPVLAQQPATGNPEARHTELLNRRGIPEHPMQSAIAAVPGRSAGTTTPELLAGQWWLKETESRFYDFATGQLSGSSRSYYAYNTQDDSTVVEDWALDTSTQVWKKNSRQELTYDSGNNLVEDLNLLYDEPNSQWINSTRTMYDYLSGSLVHNETFQIWLSTAWQDNTQTTTEYDSQNREVSVTDKNKSGANWVNETRTLYTYGQDVYPQTETEQNWGGSVWNNNEKWTYYSQSGAMTVDSVRHQYWVGGTWTDSTMTYFNYTNNQPTSVLEKKWDGAQWVNLSRVLYHYHNTSAVDTLTTQMWNGSDWDNASRLVYSYNQSNKVTMMLIEQWFGNSWMGVTRLTYTYDSDGNLSLSTDEFNMVTSWSKTLETQYYWTQTRPTTIITPVERPVEQPSRFTLHQNYPNPFNPSTVISYELPVAGRVRLSVFDITGRLVATLLDREQASGRHQVRFDGSGLASGIYFYRLQSDRFTQIRKMTLIK